MGLSPGSKPGAGAVKIDPRGASGEGRERRGSSGFLGPNSANLEGVWSKEVVIDCLVSKGYSGDEVLVGAPKLESSGYGTSNQTLVHTLHPHYLRVSEVRSGCPPDATVSP